MYLPIYWYITLGEVIETCLPVIKLSEGGKFSFFRLPSWVLIFDVLCWMLQEMLSFMALEPILTMLPFTNTFSYRESGTSSCCILSKADETFRSFLCSCWSWYIRDAPVPGECKGISTFPGPLASNVLGLRDPGCTPGLKDYI